MYFATDSIKFAKEQKRQAYTCVYVRGLLFFWSLVLFSARVRTCGGVDAFIFGKNKPERVTRETHLRKREALIKKSLDLTICITHATIIIIIMHPFYRERMIIMLFN